MIGLYEENTKSERQTTLLVGCREDGQMGDSGGSHSSRIPLAGLNLWSKLQAKPLKSVRQQKPLDPRCEITCSCWARGLLPLSPWPISQGLSFRVKLWIPLWPCLHFIQLLNNPGFPGLGIGATHCRLLGLPMLIVKTAPIHILPGTLTVSHSLLHIINLTHT